MNSHKMILITLALLIINGCTGLFNNEKQGYFTSQISLKNFKLSPSITQDMVDFLQNYYPISKTTFYFQLAASAYPQDATVEESLRKVGYGISYIRKKGRIPFAYKIDFISEGIMRTTYNIGTSTLSRLYKIEEGKVQPISAFTSRGFQKRIYLNHSTKSYSLVKKAVVSIPILNIRNRPSSKGKITGQYHKNSLLYVELPSLNKEGEKWSRVIQKDVKNNRVSSNAHEYVASRYIQYLK